MDVRRLTVDDLPAAWEALRIAFGQSRDAPEGWLADRPGRVRWGVFDGDRIVASAADREQSHWFGGRLVPASGIGGVLVVPEHRGRGLARLVLTQLLQHARDRGALIATLFRTAPGPYRRLGCEEVGTMTTLAIPAGALAGMAVPSDVTLRPPPPPTCPPCRRSTARWRAPRPGSWNASSRSGTRHRRPCSPATTA